MNFGKSGRESLAQRLSGFADLQPTQAHRAEQARADKDEAEEARKLFIEFVIDGAHVVRDQLAYRDAKADQFPDYTNRMTLGGRFAGYYLRSTNPYGSRNSPNNSNFGVNRYWSSVNTSPHTRKLIILAGTGELAISGFNTRDGIVQLQPANSDWFRAEAVNSYSEGLTLQNTAEADMQQTLTRYIGRS